MLKIKNTGTVYSYSISVCMGSFVFGYQLTSMGNLLSSIVAYNQISQHQQLNTLALIISVMPLTAIFGALLYKPITNNLGDIQTFRYFDFLTIIASIIGMLSLSISTQVISRILFGFIVGMNTILIPIYLTSVLPGSMGGPAGTLNQLFITIGIFFGTWFGFLVVDDPTGFVSWRFIIGFPIIPTLIRLYTTKNVYPYQTLEKIIRDGDDISLRSYLNLMYQPISLEQFKALKKLPDQDIFSQQTSFFDPRGQPYRRRLFMAAGIVLFNQVSGGTALGKYGGQVFAKWVGYQYPSDILQIFVWLMLLQVVVTFFSGQFIQKYGARSFMMQGQRVIIVSLLLIAFIEFFVPELYIFTIALIFVQMIGFSLSFGPCSFLIGTQIMHDITYPSVLLWVFIFLNGLLTGPFIDSIGIGPLCFIYFILSVIGFLYISSLLPETQGKSRQALYAQFRSQCSLHVSKLPVHEKKETTEIQLTLLDKKKQGQQDYY